MQFTRRKNDINRGYLFFFLLFVCVCGTHSSARRLHICWGPALLDELFVSLCLYYREATGINFMILSLLIPNTAEQTCVYLCVSVYSGMLLLAPAGAVFRSASQFALS